MVRANQYYKYSPKTKISKRKKNHVKIVSVPSYKATKKRGLQTRDYLFAIFAFLVVFGLISPFFNRVSKVEPVKEVEAKTEQSPTPTVSPSPKPTPTISKWIAFKQAAQKVCPMFNFPCKVVISQGQLESATGKSTYCVTRNNCLGINAVDWNPDNALAFENMEQSVIKYMLTIKENFPTAWAHRDNPDKMIEYIKYDPATKLNYATDPDYVRKVKSMSEWRK